MDTNRLVFVGGLHRSGTTPLASALGTHPEISALTDTGVHEDEGQHLQSIYPRARTFGGAGRFARAAEAHLTESSPLATPASAHELLKAWTPYWDLSSTLLLEKSPPNLIMGRFLQEVFPGSSLIVIIRHPAVVALSTKKWTKLASRKWWRHTTLTELVEHWMRAHDTFLADLPKLSKTHVLFYEDLLAQPRYELGRIQQFLGLQSEISPDSINRHGSARYEAQWEALASGMTWDRSRRRSIEHRYAVAASRFGYNFTDLNAHTPVDLHELAGSGIVRQ